MTIAGALAITGELYGRIERQLLIISGVAFVLAVGFCIAAVWTAVLTLSP